MFIRHWLDAVSICVVTATVPACTPQQANRFGGSLAGNTPPAQPPTTVSAGTVGTPNSGRTSAVTHGPGRLTVYLNFDGVNIKNTLPEDSRINQADLTPVGFFDVPKYCTAS